MFWLAKLWATAGDGSASGAAKEDAETDAANPSANKPDLKLPLEKNVVIAFLLESWLLAANHRFGQTMTSTRCDSNGR